MTPDELTAIRHRWSNYAGRKLPIQTAWADVEALLTALTEAEALAERLSLDLFAREQESELLRKGMTDPPTRQPQRCDQPVWDGPYKMLCGHAIINGACVRHGPVGVGHPQPKEQP